MPHVILKLWPGKSEAQKRDLSDAIVRDVTEILNYGAESVSVSFEEVAPSDWSAQVYEPDIQRQMGHAGEATGLWPGQNPTIEQFQRLVR